MGDIKIGRITLGSGMTNCYFLYREGEKEIIVVDPADKGQYLYEQFVANGFEVGAILLTHGHFDHIYGVKSLRELSGAKVYAHIKEAELLNDVDMNVSSRTGRCVTVIADEWFNEDSEYTLCNMTFKVLHTPGHTGGGTCYYFEEAGILVSGDTLFNSSVGRTDFPTGSMSALVNSIREKLMILPDDTRVYPGHGERTTIGFERENNPFL